MADSQGNIYVAIANGADPVTWNGEPTKVVKLNSDGVIQWTREEALLDYDTTGHWPWDDLWEMATDSEGNTYLSLQSAPAGTNNYDYGLVKYDTNGNRIWTRLEDFSGWDSPRGMALDPSGNYIYQNGDANLDYCGILKYDKAGNLLDKKVLPITNPTYGHFAFCYGSTVNRFGNWLLQGTYDTGGISVITQYKTEDLSQINLFEGTFEGVTPASNNGQTRAARDRYENMYAVQTIGDYDYSQKLSIGIIKTINTFSNSIPGSGTPLTLVNKTPVNYNTLNGFSATYGPMDQADVGFQISNDGINWYFWNGSTWVKTIGYDSNTTAEVNANISKFSDQFGPGQFYFKTFMVTDGTKEVDLASITITKDLPLGALPATGENNNNILLLIISSLSFATFVTAALIRRFIIISDQNR
jgi:LPXTG-motif cell wall-anchored protein